MLVSQSMNKVCIFFLRTSICQNEISLFSLVNTFGVLSRGGESWPLVAFNTQLFLPSCVQGSSRHATKVGHCGVWGDALVQE